jgi:hypothetical protein
VSTEKESARLDADWLKTGTASPFGVARIGKRPLGEDPRAPSRLDARTRFDPSDLGELAGKGAAHQFAIDHLFAAALALEPMRKQYLL